MPSTKQMNHPIHQVFVLTIQHNFTLNFEPTILPTLMNYVGKTYMNIRH